MFQCKIKDCTLPNVKGEYCVRHYVLQPKSKKKTQLEKYQHHKLYYTNTWKKLRVKKLSMSATCEHCNAVGQEIDHIIDHKGDRNLFYDLENLQTLCTPCHSRKTMQTINMSRYKETNEKVLIIINDSYSVIEDYSEKLNLKGNEDYLLDLIVRGNESLTFKVKTKLEAQNLKRAFILAKKINPIFEIIKERGKDANAKREDNNQN